MESACRGTLRQNLGRKPIAKTLLVAVTARGHLTLLLIRHEGTGLTFFKQASSNFAEWMVRGSNW